MDDRNTIDISIQELVSLIQHNCQLLVNTPELLDVTWVRTLDGLLIIVEAPQDQMGALIGAGGKVANSLRTIAKAIGAKCNLGKVQIMLEAKV